MNRPWSVVVILIFTVLFVIAGTLATIYLRALGQEGYLDPMHLSHAMSPVHTSLLVLEGVLAVAAAISLFLLRRVAQMFYLGVLAAEIVDLAYFYIKANQIDLDLSIFIVIGLLLYSRHLYRVGFLS